MLLGLPDFHGHAYVTVRHKNLWKRFLGWAKISLAQYQNLNTRVTHKNERLGSWSNSISIWIYVHFQFLLHYRFPYILWCVCVCQVGVWNCLVQEICFWSISLKIGDNCVCVFLEGKWKNNYVCRREKFSKERGNWLKAQGAVSLKYVRILLPISL